MKKKLSPFRSALLIFVFAATALVSFRFSDNYFEISKNLEIFTTLYRELNLFYVDETQPGDLMKHGIDGMLNSLDPYTTYIPESDIEDYRFMTTGEYGGIGSLIRSVDGGVYISEPYEGFPAAKSGLKAGDRILEIDGKTVEGKNQEQISNLLKGQSGTPLVLTIDRNGEKKSVSLTREEIKIPDVPYYGMLDDKTGYMRLTSFTRTASNEVKAAFIDLKEKQGMQQLIFDLRGNGGGLLREAVNIVNFFVPKGSEIVSTRGKIEEWDKTYTAQNEPLDTKMPLVILVDQASASASEIVSGALQDLDRAVIVGQRTFGKGLVQQTRELQYNSKLKLTVAKYYIPSGRCIQKLDYSHRDFDGSVDEVPDSLINTFRTQNGRKVTDGRGILPDQVVPDHEYPPVLGSLLSQSLFFKYANKFQREHNTIAPAKSFELSDEEYNDFVAFLRDKHYSYTSRTETLFEKLKEVATDEKFMENSAEAFAKFEQHLDEQKKNDLRLFRDDISDILENEIVSRYYYQVGRIQHSLASDAYIKEAMQSLNPEMYASILSPADDEAAGK